MRLIWEEIDYWLTTLRVLQRELIAKWHKLTGYYRLYFVLIKKIKKHAKYFDSEDLRILKSFLIVITAMLCHEWEFSHSIWISHCYMYLWDFSNIWSSVWQTLWKAKMNRKMKSPNIKNADSIHDISW